MLDKKNEPSEDTKPTAAHSRREFLQDAVFTAGPATIFGNVHASAQTNDNGTSGLKKAAGYKVESWNLTPKADGRELDAVLQASDEQGYTEPIHIYARWIYAGDTYTVFHHVPATAFSQGVSAIISGRKGPVEGDYRRDMMSTVTISDQGEIQRSGPSEVKVLIRNPYEGMSLQDTIDQFVKDKSAGRWVH
jgi:hypothetical protein